MAVGLPKHSSIRLHCLLHLQADLRGVEGAVGVPDLIEEFNAFDARLFGNTFVGFARCQVLLDVDCTSTTEDDDIEEGVGSETVGSVNRYASSLTCSVEPRNNLVFAVLINGQNLAGVLGRNTTH